jgi:hypothetical protein
MSPIPAAPLDLLRETDEAVTFRVPFLLWPKPWTEFTDTTPLEWHRVRFSGDNLDAIPNADPGVYSFVVEPGIAIHPACAFLLYVGMTDRPLRARYQDYLRERTKVKARPHIQRMLLKWPDHLYFYYSAVPAGTDIKQLEDALINGFMPPMNRQLPARVRRVIGAFPG